MLTRIVIRMTYDIVITAILSRDYFCRFRNNFPLPVTTESTESEVRSTASLTDRVVWN